MKKFLIVFITVLCLVCALTLCACGKDNTPETDNNQTQTPEPDTGNNDTPIVEPEPLPTAAEIVAARAAEKEKSLQGYDFDINLNGSVSVFLNANGNYSGKYRYDSSSNDLKFTRTTSGALLYDSTEYIYSQGDARIKIKTDENGGVKKMEVIASEDDELNLINLPFVAIVDHLEENNLSAIKKNTDSAFSKYKYSAKMAFASDNPLLGRVFGAVGKMGAKIVIKNISFANPQNGITLYFNYEKGASLTDFAFKTDVNFPVNSLSTTISLSYEQNGSNASFAIPFASGLSVDRSEIESKVEKINNAIIALKNSAAYSVDMTASNDFDPGASVTAIVDKYIAAMYKNTNDSRVDFNHSYKFKAHTERDGAESFKYTVGNLTDETIYLISRSGSNTQTQLFEDSVDKHFDFLFSAAMFDVSDIDCIKTTVEKDGSTKLRLVMNDKHTLSVQQTICEILNSNNESDVTDVENYLNYSECNIADAEYVVTLSAKGALMKIECNTKLKYMPTGGAYTDKTVTLKNSVVIEVNEKLEKAQKYEAPKKLTGIGSLNASGCYLL